MTHCDTWMRPAQSESGHGLGTFGAMTKIRNDHFSRRGSTHTPAIARIALRISSLTEGALSLALFCARTGLPPTMSK